MEHSYELLDTIKTEFEGKSGLRGVSSEIREKEGGGILVMEVANPTDRLFSLLEEVRAEVAPEEESRPLATLVKGAGENPLEGAEGRLLLSTLTESLNIHRYSFRNDFLSRYTNSLFGAEEQICAPANHIVYGRRGAGKSTLLLYALHRRDMVKMPSIWIDMQVYARRADDGVIGDALRDMLEQTSKLTGENHAPSEVLAALQSPEVSELEIRRLLPPIRRRLSCFAEQGQNVFIFLDDFHVIAPSLQPRLLDVLYAVARGNQIFLKLSAIETLTRTFEPESKVGLEISHDAQLIPLDYNLTAPDKATEHIQSILDSHAVYCGLPSIRKLCTSHDVIPRLTWVAAGVPRDALNLFAQAMTKATLNDRKHVSVSNINIAASEIISTKLRELEADASSEARALQELLEKVRKFCVETQRRNAFLVEIKGDDTQYRRIRSLVDLRLLHVISEGITIREAGRKYLGLILDYGFYIGIRAARSVDLFNRQTSRVAYKDVRGLPVFGE